jgi:hypothetical protein
MKRPRVLVPLDGSALAEAIRRELARYDSVLIFESAACAGRELDRGNPFRIESRAQAAPLDAARARCGPRTRASGSFPTTRRSSRGSPRRLRPFSELTEEAAS